MLTKLAFKNASKSFKDYAVYFFTLVLGVCVFYMFNSIYAQQEIMVVTETTNQSMVALRQLLSYISAFVAVILGFLIIYANNFFIKRRKKELGIYMTLGMTKRKISTILLLETSIMAMVALIVGLVAGIFSSQFMSFFTAKIFEADMSAYKFVFSMDATLKSILYFGLIFLTVILFNTFAIGKFNLIDLIYGGRKNESLKIKSTGVAIAIFIMSIISLGLSYYIILKNGMININFWFLLSLILGVSGTVLFFLSMSTFIIKLVQGNKKLYYKNLNIFVLRQLNSKVNTNFISISVVSIVLLLVIGIFSSGYSMQNIFSKELQNSVPFSFSIANYYDEGNYVNGIYDSLPAQLKNSEYIESYDEHKIYIMKNGDNHYEDYELDLSSIGENFVATPLNFMSLSDYNDIRKLQGLEPHTLANSNYLVLVDDVTEDIGVQFINDNKYITINGEELSPIDMVSKTATSNTNYVSIAFVVNDRFLESMTIQETVLNIQCKNEEDAAAFDVMLKEYRSSVGKNSAFAYYISRQYIYANSITTKALVSFLAIYLGFVFMITCAAILALQQLSEAEDNRGRYVLLKKLGAEKSMLNKALFAQILSYFLLPLSLAIVHSIVGLSAANEVIQQFGKIDVFSSIITTAIFVVFVYGAYFTLTYIGSKNIINKG
ncbi:FtsX-like permease family protein [Clostridium grantii]|uniref:Putative ABC transport system permease protein n=1 Tax=Clostridium grantii DSM 8605 TaxID=1121316 RepID=A0A1M5VKZ2_9CLOT|nr:ABC transporter permease [Clostridium grantii]SHH75848.1 putative ABC transport system permease protein [Clostridium grantii DSM 8605]